MATARDVWNRPDLSGRIALVTGATRGVGRGIAEVLGECGATVYVTGRSTRTKRTFELGSTTQDVAAAVTDRGGKGIAVRCDHKSEAQVARLFGKIDREQGRIDVMVSNAIGWGDVSGDGNAYAAAPIWEKPVEWWDGNFDVGMRSHFMACRYGSELMRRSGGLIVLTSELPDESVERKDVVLDLRAHATRRMAMVLARQLRSKAIGTIVLVPGFPRTEGILDAWDQGSPYFDGWTEDDFIARTESVHYSGRAAASLAGDPNIMERSGSVMRVLDAARAYGFTDTDGRVATSLFDD
jgi:NAD(P)-dependent dehydrogenase (short-subunit alcohol dehydrogenase family)